MYHAFTGRLPFIADSAVAVLTAHALDPPPPPSHVSSIDPGVEQVILRCLEKQPAARYASMHELAEVLRHLRRLGGQQGLPPAQSGPFARVDTQSGASLSGPHASVAARVSMAHAAPVARSGNGLAVVVGGLAMLALGGAGAAALLIHRTPAPAAAVPSVLIVESTATSVTAIAPTAPPSVSATSVTIDATASASAAPAASASGAAVAKTGSLPNGSWKPPPPTAGTGTKFSPEIRNPFDKDDKK
jgi:hypothetical protein